MKTKALENRVKRGAGREDETLAHLASFPELNPEPVMEVDAGGRVHYLNPAAKKLFAGLEKAGLEHAWLSGVGDAAAELDGTKKGRLIREIQVGDKWYEQDIVSGRDGVRLQVYGRDITERKRAEAALRESEQKYRELVENANSIIIRWKPDGEVMLFNRFAQSFFGYSPDEILGRNVSVLVPDKETTGRNLSHLLEDIVANPESYRMFENENVRRDGERVWVQWTNRALFDEAGRVREVLAVGHDITARKRAESELEASRAELQAARDELETRVKERTFELARTVQKLEAEVQERRRTQTALAEQSRILDTFFGSAVTPLVFLDKDFNFIRVNEAYAKACQRPASDFPGHNHFEFYPNEENEAIFKEVVRTKTPHRALAKPFTFADHPEWGVTYWDWSLSPVLDESGAIEFLIFSLNDVTEEARAQEEIKKNEAVLRSVLDTLPIGVWITDRQGRIVMGNPAGREIWGGARYVGLEQYGEYKGWWADTGEKIRPEEWAAARAVTEGETSINEEVEIECFDGTRKFIFNSALPIRDGRNEITGVIIINQDITRRREGEKKRREQAALLDLARDAILVRDPELRITFWNSGARETYGWTEREAMGQGAPNFLKTQFPEPLEIAQKRLFAEGHWEGELVRSRKDGGRIIVESRWAVLRGKDGRTPVAILEISRDITERKKTQEALKTAAAYTRGLIEASLDPLVTISPEGKITDVNRATELATGVERTRLIESDFSDYFTEPEKAREGYREVFSKGSVRDYPLAIRHASGKVTDVLYNATVYRDEAGEAAGVFAAARDITERKAAEQERLRLATAVEQIAEGIAITDPEGRILSANPAFGTQHGLRPADIVGRTLSEVLHFDARDREVVRKMREGLNSGSSWTWHLNQRMRDGQVRELELAVSPIRDSAGRLVNAIAIERDVTQETILQERIRQWQKMEALGTLAGGIAHDFNNILLPIIINTELTLAGEKEDGPVARRLGQVLEAARRGKDMVKQIIAFSRQKEQERQPVEIPPLIRESLKFLRVSMPKNIEIAEKIESESAMAVADPTQIHQILMNLGSNAAHAMREKGGLLEVGLSEVSLDEEAASRYIDLRPGAYLRLTVRDTGHGMSPEVRARVFEPFFTTKKQGEGTGMGLAVVHGIVKSHGGAVTVESAPGKGTTFAIYLPRITGTPAAEKEAPQPFPRGSERILFVDDEDIQVRAMNKLLEFLGYTVVGMSDPRTALDAFRREPGAFDLLISDQTMPHVSGLELTREVLRIKPGLPVILCTGYSESINEEAALSSGVSAFMLKPFSVREIAETIRRVLPAKA